jgi:hypothetical protein
MQGTCDQQETSFLCDANDSVYYVVIEATNRFCSVSVATSLQTNLLYVLIHLRFNSCYNSRLVLITNAGEGGRLS